MKQQLHHLMAMAKRLALMLVLFAAVVPAIAQEDFYAIYNPETTTLTFKKCVKQADDGNTYYKCEYDANSRWPWIASASTIKKVVIDESFKQCELTTCRFFFYSLGNVANIKGLANLNTLKVKDMGYMFYGCTKLANLDLTGFVTSAVTDMNSMFYKCASLAYLDLTGFDTSKVTTMRFMLGECTKLSGLDLTGFVTSAVTDMNSMFFNCASLNYLDLTGFDTSKVTTMRFMFGGCTNLFALDLTGFVTSAVTDMKSMFGGCTNLLILELNSKDFDTSKVTDMSSMFFKCEKLSSLDVKDFNTSNVENMEGMFNMCSSLNSLDVKSFNTSNVKNMSFMFQSCEGLTSLDVKNFITSKVENMSYMFQWCSNLSSLDVKNFNTSKVTMMNCMFRNCSKLSSLDLTNFDTSKVTDMSYMFEGCKILTSLNLSSFNTSNVTGMAGMFSNCEKLPSLNLKHFDTSKADYMSDMFNKCSSLTALDLTNFNTSNVENMHAMFANCSNLTSLDLKNFNTSKVQSMSYMFSNCLGLTTLDLTSFDTSKVWDMNSMFDVDYSQTSKLSSIYVNAQFQVPDGYTWNMFKNCIALPNYNENKVDGTMANYTTGYFKTYYKMGTEQHDLHGEDLIVTDLPLTDGDDFVAYAPFKAQSATYSRTLSNRWATLCLPYAVQVEDVQDCDIYSVVESLADGVLTVERMESGSVAAGQPVLLRRKGDAMVTVTFSAADADVVKAPTANTENAYNLMGSFVATQVPQDCYTIANNKFWLVSSVNTDQKKVWIKGFRAYIQPKAQPTAAPASLTIGEGNATAIDSVEGDGANLLEAATNGQAEIYNAAGVRLGSLQKGLNIIRMGKRSQKVIIK